ncbi:helix-turn-helix domain-containing protein [Marinoscillum pacificum]|uniref:helix-turn-helix domain-containing protein n=1 Tax=Marinoscillum pacificum TaxID=392723 RepID=UPI0021578E9B|nr:helix-turn-helix transcriptional regulator [Marinoscillum pacificum]
MISEQALITEFITGLEFYFKNPQIVNDQLLELKVKELILLLLQTSNAKSIATLFSQLFSEQEINLNEIVNSHLFTDCSIQDLAYLAHMSESTFKRRFRELYNDSPANYFKVKRLERASELLQLPRLSITEITYQVGFNDVAHFSRSFKSVYGRSPKAYREQYIDRNEQKTEPHSQA